MRALHWLSRKFTRDQMSLFPNLLAPGSLVVTLTLRNTSCKLITREPKNRFFFFPLREN